MKATITFKHPKQSKFTGKNAYLLGFKFEDGTNRKAWIDEGYRNFSRWQGKMIVGAVLDNLILTGDNLVDADSFPAIVAMPSVEPQKPLERVIESKTTDIPETTSMFDTDAL